MMIKYILIILALFSLNNLFSEENEDSQKINLSLPDKTWAVEMDFSNFEVQDQGFLPEFKGRKIQATNDKNGLVLSVFLVPAEKKMTAKEYRDYAFKNLQNGPFKLSDVKKYEKENIALSEYMIKDFEDFKDFNQKNIFIYLVKGDTWIDFHLSKVKYNEEDDSKIFNDFINSIRIIDNAIPTSYDNFIFGSYFYNEDDYEKAIIYYQRAFDQECKSQELPDVLWTVLIDNLGMAYGISGNLAKSKEIFEYGISIKPLYPLFYYNLACTYAEMGNLDNAIINLQKAFKYKENMIDGETFPNPSDDDSFSKYKENSRFKAFLNTIEL